MMRAWRAAALVCAVVVWSPPASAGKKVYKHDQFPEDLATTVALIGGMTLATQPGWAQGEGFGVIFEPDPSDYPLEIRKLHLVLGGPEGQPNFSDYADIEIWNSTAEGFDPGLESPTWVINSSDLFDPLQNKDGIPLEGNTAISIEFDYDDPDGHPPLIFEGRIWVVIRYKTEPQNLAEQWGNALCDKIPGYSCGCQKFGTLHDQGVTNSVNVVSIYPGSSCAGTPEWKYLEDVSGDLGLGDLIMRLEVEASGSACVPDCTGKQCGSDGCGGNCGACEADEACSAGTCVSLCEPDCSDKACGSEDGCGGVCQSGLCPGAQECVAGECSDPCAVDCAGKACGADDGCGGECQTGTCDPGFSCVAGSCVGDCTADCTGVECGDDGCGGSCGVCEGGLTCAGGACVSGCTPDCTNADCGGDGCGGTCGSCAGGETCDGGSCVPVEPVGGLSIETVSPAWGWDDEDTAITISGRGFAEGLTVKLGADALSDVDLTGDKLVSATVPAGLKPGSYALFVINPDDESAFLEDAFEIRARDADACGDGECSVADGESCEVCPLDCGPCSGVSGGASSGCDCQGGPGIPAQTPLYLIGIFLAAYVAFVRRRLRDD